MLETTRDLGHATGATISSFIVALILPAAIGLMLAEEAQPFYMKGFQTSALAVVGIMTIGAIIAAFHKSAAKRTGGTGKGQQPASAGAAAD